MYYTFDLDGTLVDSKELVVASYKAIGVTPPKDFFGKSWKEWLKGNDTHTAEELHRAKNDYYIALIPRHLKPLPLLKLYKSLMRYDTVGLTYAPVIITGASLDATKAVLENLGLSNVAYNVHTEMSVEDKIRWMIGRCPGIMFEDSIEAAEKMKRETRWTICYTLP